MGDAVEDAAEKSLGSFGNEFKEIYVLLSFEDLRLQMRKITLTRTFFENENVDGLIKNI